MKFPFTKKQVQQFGLVAVSYLCLVGVAIMNIELWNTVLRKERHLLQETTTYGMILCKLKPSECDARYEEWQAKQKLNELLQQETNND